MSNGIEISVTGNMTREVELRFSQQGTPWATFSLAVNEVQSVRGERTKETSFLDCKIFGEAAENLAESVTKGTRVMIQGKMRQDTWKDKNTGENRSAMKVYVDEAGPSLRWARAKVTRQENNNGDFNGNGGGRGGRGSDFGGGGDFGGRGSRGNDFGGQGRSGGSDFGGGDDPFSGSTDSDDPFGGGSRSDSGRGRSGYGSRSGSDEYGAVDPNNPFG